MPEERSVKKMFYREGTVKVFGESEMEDVFIRTGALYFRINVRQMTP